jgi:hypothetical protein
VHLQKLLALTLILLACGGAARLSAAPSQAAQRTIPAGASIQKALDAAAPGDTLLLAAGAYNESLTVKTSGASQAPITLKGAGAGATTLKGVVRIQGSFLALEDLAVDAGGSDDDAVEIAAPANDVRLSRVHLYNGTGYGVRVGSDVARVLIEGCTIDNFDAGSSDAHGVGIMTAREVTIRECDISNTSGDAIQVNTPDYPGYGRAAEQIRIERNRLHDTRENALDIKSTHGLVAHGNLAWGFRAVDSSDGMAIQVQYDARDITLTGNQIWSAVEGVEVSRGVKNGTAYPLAPSGVLIAGNLIRGLVHDPAGDSGSGSGIVVRSSGAVRVYNNTVLGAPGAGVYVGVSRSGDYPQRLDIRNNVLEGRGGDLTLSFAPAQAPGLVVDYNHYVSGRVGDGSLDQWRGAGYERHPTQGDAQLGPDWRPLDGSPLRDSGADVGLPYQGAAPDRGWGELPDVLQQPALDHRTYLPLARR